MSDFQIEELPAQPYVAVVGHVTMQTVPAIADRFGEVFGWLAARGVTPAGSPFLCYRVIDMAGELVIEAAVPTGEQQTGEGEIVAATVPGGRYVTTTHLGHPDQLTRITEDLLGWAEQQGLTFDVEPSAAGEVWGARLEIYDTDPAVEADVDRWQTRLAVRLAE